MPASISTSVRNNTVHKTEEMEILEYGTINVCLLKCKVVDKLFFQQKINEEKCLNFIFILLCGNNRAIKQCINPYRKGNVFSFLEC